MRELRDQLILSTGEGKQVLQVGVTDSVTDALSARGCQVTVVSDTGLSGDVARPEGGFGVALLYDVLQRFSDPRGLLEQVSSLLAPDGQVVASIPNVAHGSVRLALLGGEFPFPVDGEREDTVLHHFTRGTAEQLFADAGLRIIAWRGVQADPLVGYPTDGGDHVPRHLVDALRRDMDALALHYVVRAVRVDSEVGGVSVVRESPVSRALQEMDDAWTKMSRFDPHTFALIAMVHRRFSRLFPPGSLRRRLVLRSFRRLRFLLGGKDGGSSRAASSEAGAPAERYPAHLREELDAFLGDPEERLTLPAAGDPLVSILIVTYNNAEHTFRCLSAIAEFAEVPCETIVVDNGSTDVTVGLLDRVDGVTFVRNEENLHFLRGTNQAAQHARGRYLLLLNNDAYLQPGTLPALLEAAQSTTDIGAVGAKLLRADGRLQEAGSIVWQNGSATGYGRDDDPERGEYRFRRDVDFCSAACLLVRRDLFEEVGGFDPRYEPAYYEDADLCMSLWAHGYRVVCEPRAAVVHNEFTSSDREQASLLMRRNRPVFQEKWAKELGSQVARDDDLAVLRARDRRPGPSVLVLDDRVPAAKYGAGLPRMRTLLRFLAEEGFRVTFVPMFHSELPQPDTEELEAEGVEVLEVPRTGMDVADVERILRERSGLYETVLVSRPHNAVLVIPLVRKLAPRASVVYDAEALFYRREETRALLDEEAPDTEAIERMRDVEHRLIQASDRVLAVSEGEAELMQERSEAGNISVWGHPCEVRPSVRPFSLRADVLFVGVQAPDSPNEDGVVYFARDILPRIQVREPDLGLRVAGRPLSESVSALASRHVQIEGLVEDLDPLYEDCRVFVNPVRYGAGIPLKLVEAMGRGIPAVTTEFGARSLGLRDGEHAMVAANDEEFAEKTLRLYRDEALWAKVREGALAWVEGAYDPGRMKGELVEICRAAQRSRRALDGKIRGKDASAFSIARNRLRRARLGRFA